MKQGIIGFLLAIVLIVGMSATTLPNLLTVKPVIPKHTEVKSFRTIVGLETDIKKYIDSKIKKVYIVKSVAMMDDETFSKGIVVMEKY